MSNVLQEVQQPKTKAPRSLLEASQYINYDSVTGLIQHAYRRNSNGSYDHYGYLIIKIKGTQWKAHRLAYAKYYNCNITGIIDHINGDKKDNRICNLRNTTQAVNTQNGNYRRNSETGCQGINIDKATRGLKAKYTVRCMNTVVRFRTLEEAINYRKQKGMPV